MAKVSRGKVNHLKELYGCVHPALWPYVRMYQAEARTNGFPWLIPANIRNIDMSQYKGY